MVTWDDKQEWESYKVEMTTEKGFHICPKWDEQYSYYLDGKFYQVCGFGGDGGPKYNEETPEILEQATFCLFCGARVKPLQPEGPLLADQEEILIF